MSAMIELQGVSKSFGQNKVLRGCSLTVDRGDVVVICGPSGSGKSTLIKCINGLVPHDTGDIKIEGQAVGGVGSDWPKLRAKIGMVFQHFELYPHMSALANISLAQIHVLRRSRAEADYRSRRLLERVGLAAKADAMPANLSGGEQQRVAIAGCDPVRRAYFGARSRNDQRSARRYCRTRGRWHDDVCGHP